MGRSVHDTKGIMCQSNRICSELGGGNRARSRFSLSHTARGLGNVPYFLAVMGSVVGVNAMLVGKLRTREAGPPAYLGWSLPLAGSVSAG